MVAAASIAAAGLAAAELWRLRSGRRQHVAVAARAAAAAFRSERYLRVALAGAPGVRQPGAVRERDRPRGRGGGGHGRTTAPSGPGARPRDGIPRGLRRDGGARASSARGDRKSTRLNSSHLVISYAVFCLKKKKK